MTGAPAGRSRRMAAAAGICLLFFGLAAMFWWLRIIAPAAQLSRQSFDLFQQVLPMSHRAAEWIRQGAMPLWNPYQLCGVPFLAAAQYGVLYPLNALYLFLPAAVAIEAATVVHFFLAGAFAFAYCRTVGLGSLAAAVAGIAFMFSGFLVHLALWFTPIFSAAVWLPLQFLAVERIVRRRTAGGAVLLAVAVAMPALAGGVQIWLYQMYATGFYAGARAVGQVIRGGGWSRALSAAGTIAAGLGLGVCLTAPQVLPSLELQGLGPRRIGALPVEQTLDIGAPAPGQLLSGALGRRANGGSLAYLGIGALLLMPLSLLWRRGRGLVVCLWCLALLSAAVALTVHTPVFRYFLLLPGTGWFRAHQRVLLVYAFCGAVLAGIGVDAAIQALASPVKGRLAAAAGRAGAWVPSAAGLVLLGLAATLAWDVFHATANQALRPYHRPGLADGEREAFDFVRERQGLARTYVHGSVAFPDLPAHAVMPKQGTLRGIYSIADYEPLSLRRYARLYEFFEGRPGLRGGGLFVGELWLKRPQEDHRLLDLTGVRFMVADRDDPSARRAPGASGAAWRRVFEAREGRRVVYEHRSPLPRAYVAPVWASVAGEEAAFAAVTDPSFDPWGGAVVEAAGRGDAEEGGGTGPAGIVPARIASYRPSRVVVETDAGTAGMLVLTDTFYPGWRATVDGRRAGIYRANYLFRGVYVRAGPHVVVFTYEPLSFRLGAAITAAALALACAVVAVAVVRRRQGAAPA